MTVSAASGMTTGPAGRPLPPRASSYYPARTGPSRTLEAWLHGTHRWASRDHLPVYLDEYVFRHNRRGNPHPCVPGPSRAQHPPPAKQLPADHRSRRLKLKRKRSGMHFI